MEELPVIQEPAYINFPDKKRRVFYGTGAAALLLLFYILVLSAPAHFPVGSTVRVEKGVSLRSVSTMLVKENIVRSRAAFEFFVILFGREKGVVSAEYYFERKLPVLEVARRLGGGKHLTAPVSVTIPEGFNVEEIADTFRTRLLSFNKESFLSKSKSLEGYLFPDTYFFFTNATEDDVIRLMNSNFEKKVEPLRGEIESSGKTREEIIIMASIIEKEAKGDGDRGIISGILWRRLSLGMALQVDAAPETYKNKGLPQMPIANPGLEAIYAALRPQASPYLYYLHDPEGKIHYAKNFAEHVNNKVKYLK